MNDIFDCGLNKDGLIKDHFGHQRFWNIDKMCDALFNSVHYRNGVGVSTLLEDRKIHRTLTVNPNDAGLDLRSVLGMSYVAD